MKLILHVGAHKTGTTTIQSNFYKYRSGFEAEGIWYPMINEVLENTATTRIQHDIPKGLLNGNSSLTEEQVRCFFEKLYTMAVAKNVESVFISSEPFYRGISGEGSYWVQKERYIKKLSLMLKLFDVEVVFVLRRQDDFLESLYNENVKTWRYTKNIKQFHEEQKFFFEYKNQIQHWAKYFNVKAIAFEQLAKGDREAFLYNFLNFIGISPSFKIKQVFANESWPLPLLDYKLKLNTSKNISDEEYKNITLTIKQNIDKIREGIDFVKSSRIDKKARLQLLEQYKTDNQWLDVTYPQEVGNFFVSDLIKDTPIHSFSDERTISKINAIVQEIIENET